jgi:uncharacterized membrane protein
MNITAAIVIGDRGWLWPAVGIIVLTVLAVWWAYRSLPTLGGANVLARGLKVTGIVILSLCLIEPLWSGVRASPGSNLFVLLADNSQSMQIHDPGKSQSRGEQVRALLVDDKAPWQVRLSQDFDVRRYLVDSRLHSVMDFGELTFDGNATALATALDQLRERFHDRPLAGVLLWTDGNATDLDGEPLDLEGLPPIYPVVVGSQDSPKDLAIDRVAVTQTAFEDAPVSIRADVTAVGYEGTVVVLRLYDEQDELIKEERQTAGPDGVPSTFRLQVRPPKPGVSFYRLQVAAHNELHLFDAPIVEPADTTQKKASRPRTAEVTLANNVRLIQVDQGRGPHRILYLAGRPNWEFKFLRRAIEDDEQVDLVGLIRIADKEPKFEFRGRVGESSNPLFRGFKKDADAETEQYDESVLVRLNVKDERELRDGFPKTEQALYQYDAVILDDLESGFFTRDQMLLLQRYVSERGGGLLMLGGQGSFHQGDYHRTPIGDMLPVYLDRVPRIEQPSEYRLALTRDGWLQPWVRLRNNEDDERQRLTDMPEFRTVNRVRSIKPGAVVLAHVTDVGGASHPALIVQRFGRGRSAALTIGDLWRWRLRQNEEENQGGADMDKAWRQMLRWLVSDVPGRIDVRVEPKSDVSGAAVELNVRVRNAEYKPLDNAGVRITVTPPDGEELILEAEPSIAEAGLFQTVYVPRSRGAYRAAVDVQDAQGETIGRSEAGWASDPAADEFRSIRPNQALLQRIAQETGGELVETNRLEQFVAGLPSRKAPITEQWTFPLWQQTWVLLLAIACLTGEWGLRRWKGLP